LEEGLRGEERVRQGSSSALAAVPVDGVDGLCCKIFTNGQAPAEFDAARDPTPPDVLKAEPNRDVDRAGGRSLRRPLATERLGKDFVT
jgi:hypothetical protein